MKRAQALTPVVVKESTKVKGFALIDRGYVQARESVDCPICSLMFLLFLDHKDRNPPGGKSTVIHQEAVRYFLDKVRGDHEDGHPHDRFAMPQFVRHLDRTDNVVDSKCVLCGQIFAASREDPVLAAAERAHNCLEALPKQKA